MKKRGTLEGCFAEVGGSGESEEERNGRETAELLRRGP